jgi:hypothetical protein
MRMVYKQYVINALEELSSKAIQEAIWFPNDQNLQSSFVEAKCQLYDDTGLGDDLKSKTVVFSPEIDEMLTILGEYLSLMDDYGDQRSIIESNAMKVVREYARSILEAIERLGVGPKPDPCLGRLAKK